MDLNENMLTKKNITKINIKMSQNVLNAKMLFFKAKMYNHNDI